MVDTSALAGLLDRARNVFRLADDLGQITALMQSTKTSGESITWDRVWPMFELFRDALIDLREPMQNPPDDFSLVADQLKEAARIAMEMKKAEGHVFAEYSDFWPGLMNVAEAGGEAVKQAMMALQLDDPLSFVDEDEEGGSAEQGFTLLSDFPSTQEGHLAFIERVRDEVHNAAQAKRQQLERGYPNDTITNMVGGIKWDEARSRLAAVVGLPADAREQVAGVLRRELAVGTVEQIDELLMPTIGALRDRLESPDATASAEKVVADGTGGKTATEVTSHSHKVGDALPAAIKINSDAQHASEQPVKKATAGDRKRDGMTWQIAALEMSKMMNRGERFTSQSDMGKRLRCSPSTICKALKNNSDLKEWAARPVSSATGMLSLNGMIADNIPQNREQDPADFLDTADVDAAMRYLMEQAGPKEKAKIDAMEPAERRQLAEMAYRDPDQAEQLMRWRKLKSRQE